jgi:branched-chain amino acid aminotransferase
MKVYVNGKILPDHQATIRFDDHGFLYGDGVYETLRVYQGQVFHMKDHLKRLHISARGIDLRVPLSDKSFAAAINSTIRANKLIEAVVRVTLSRGPGPYGFDTRPCKHPTLVITAFPFTPYPPSFHNQGITIGVVDVVRNNPRSLPPWVKSTNCLNGIMAKMQSLKMGAQEGVMLDAAGFVTEGTVSNIFIVKNKTVLTPSLSGQLLSGVTRGVVIGLAKKLKLRVVEKKISAAELFRADEVFLTNTTMEVLPVSTIAVHGRKIKKPVGDVSQRLLKAFKQSLVISRGGRFCGGCFCCFRRCETRWVQPNRWGRPLSNGPHIYSRRMRRTCFPRSTFSPNFLPSRESPWCCRIWPESRRFHFWD